MVLNGWKDIAGYLDCGVRTVQRWERAGLPVHRPVAGKRSHVVAYSEELDWWLRDHQPHHAPPAPVIITIERAKQLRDDAPAIRNALRARIRALRQEISNLRNRGRKAV